MRSRPESSSRTTGPWSSRPPRPCSPRNPPEVPRSEYGAAHRHHHLRARAARRVRGHQQGPGDPAHPLMSAANSIHGIVLAGAMLIAVTANNALGYILAFVAAAFAAMNVVGGYVVTGRMLKMFRRSRAPVPAPDTPAAVNGQRTGGRA